MQGDGKPENKQPGRWKRNTVQKWANGIRELLMKSREITQNGRLIVVSTGQSLKSIPYKIRPDAQRE